MGKCTTIFLTVAILVAAGVYPFLQTALRTANGYAAKITCSLHFVSKVNYNYYDVELVGIFKHLTTQIDEEKQLVESNLFSLFSRTAVYTPGRGCTLVEDPESYKAEPRPSWKDVTEKPDVAWPRGDKNAERISDAVQAAIEPLFPDESAKPLKERINTKAAIVIHKGKIVAEKYNEKLGITRHTRLAGWSMTKSIVNALYGIRMRDGNILLSDKIQHPQWTKVRGDPRAEITVDDVLHMTSGLDFEEVYHPFIVKDPSNMLFNQETVVDFVASKRASEKPGHRWYYSSGDSNILSWKLRQSFGSLADATSQKEYLEFPHKELFGRIGASSAIMETDAAGIYVGSSFSHLTARDWARFGLLYLNDGEADVSVFDFN